MVIPDNTNTSESEKIKNLKKLLSLVVSNTKEAIKGKAGQPKRESIAGQRVLEDLLGREVTDEEAERLLVY